MGAALGSTPLHLLLFGCGYTGRVLAEKVMHEGWRVSAALRRSEARQEAERAQIQALDIATWTPWPRPSASPTRS